MQLKNALIAAACAGFTVLIVNVAAESGAAQNPPPAAPQTPAPAGRGQGRGRGTFPAQQRPLPAPEVIDRGRAQYTAMCSACHGVDARGGQLGGPNLLRSQVVLNDQDGELIIPIVHGSRAERGMPPLPMPDEDVKAVSGYLHSLQAAARPQGAPPEGEMPLPNALVGDAAAGEAYFKGKCATCHSPTGDLQGIATRISEAKTLQNTWVTGSSGRGGGGRPGGPKPVMASITLPSGQKVEGRLVKVDDFLVTIMLADDTIRSFRRDGDRPRVEITDPLAGHKALLDVLTDKDMHDVTAFLATLK
jgi:cytochrome c oxidase cbb3-type subunit 3